MLNFVNTSVRYPRRDVRAVDDVSLAAVPGVITAIVGPNGSGKSTLVRALLRRVQLETGRIVIGERDLASISTRELARTVAVVPQREEPSVPIPVSDFVTLGRYPHRSALSALTSEDRAAIDSAIARAGVGDTVHRFTDQLSGGEWQRVRIARALAQNARVVVLDEPTAFLDIAHEMAVFELLDELARAGGTIVLVSHQLNLVARFASHIVLLHEGRVAASGTAADVMQGAVLEQVYDWPLVVTRDPAIGAPALLPLRRGNRS